MTNDWNTVQLGDVLKRVKTELTIDDSVTYKQVTVRLWNKGVVLRGKQKGFDIKTKRQFFVKTRQLVMSRIDVRNGAIGLVPKELDGAIVSNDFWVYEFDESQIYPEFLALYVKTPNFTYDANRISSGTTNRIRADESSFLKIKIPLPLLTEQRRIVKHIELLALKVDEVRGLKLSIETDLDRMLLSAYHSITDDADRKPLEEIAPLTRRLANVKAEDNYPQVAVRSFGRGTFHKPELEGAEITWQKPYLVKSGDILISNIKAWEGAIAVAGEKDDGRYGSHRYLTLVPKPDIATSRFVCFHLLTPEGLSEVGQASPGTADRNRTLGVKALMQIPIPAPPIEKQLWFDELFAKVNAVRELQVKTQEELDALLPSVLDKAFRGEL